MGSTHLIQCMGMRASFTTSYMLYILFDYNYLASSHRQLVTNKINFFTIQYLFSTNKIFHHLGFISSFSNIRGSMHTIWYANACSSVQGHRLRFNVLNQVLVLKEHILPYSIVLLREMLRTSALGALV